MKKLMILSGLLFVLSLSAVQAQNKKDVKTLFSTVKGTITDLELGQPIPQAVVYLAAKSGADTLKVVSDLDGNFKFSKVKAGVWYTLASSYVGFNPFVKDIYVLSAKENVVNIELSFGSTKLKAVEVTAQKGSRTDAINDYSISGVRSFNPLETEKFAGTFADAARMSANFAGVIVPPSTNFRNDVIIRGQSPLFIAWQLDGFEIPNPNHFGTVGTTGGAITLLNNNLLSKSDFYTGGMPAYMPNSLTGGFDLTMKKGNNEKHEFLGQIGFNGLELSGEGPISKKAKSSYLFGLRYSFLDIMKNLGFFDDSFSAPVYKDATVKLFFPFKKGNFTISSIIGDSSIDVKQSKINDDTYLNQINTQASNAFVGARYTHFLSPQSSLSVEYSLNQPISKLKLDSLYTPVSEKKYLNQYASDSKLVKQTAGVKLKIRAKKSLFSFGSIYSNNLLKNVETLLLTEVTSPEQADKNRGFKANSEDSYNLLRSYAEWKLQPNENWTVYLGLNHQYFFHNEKNAIDPRFSMFFNLNQKQRLGLSVGKFSQLPSLVYYTFRNEYNPSAGTINDDLGYLESIHYILSYDINFKTDLHLKVEGYYQQEYNIPVSKDPLQSGYYSMINAGDNFVINSINGLVNEGKGKNYGVEVTFEQLFNSKFYYLFTGSVFKARYTSYDGTERDSSFGSGYTLNILGGYEWQIVENQKLSIDMRLNMSGPRPYLPLDLKASELQKNDVYDYAHAYENTRDKVFRLDFKATYFIQFKKFILSGGIDITNLTNYKNVVLTYYDFVNKEEKKVYSTGIFPVGFFRINF